MCILDVFPFELLYIHKIENIEHCYVGTQMRYHRLYKNERVVGVSLKIWYGWWRFSMKRAKNLEIGQHMRYKHGHFLMWKHLLLLRFRL